MCQNMKTKPKLMRHRGWLISFAANQMCWTHCNNSETLGRARNTRNQVSGLSPYFCFDVFLTVHHCIDLFHLPTLMHNSFIH
jgi:hypothetical protein